MSTGAWEREKRDAGAKEPEHQQKTLESEIIRVNTMCF